MLLLVCIFVGYVVVGLYICCLFCCWFIYLLFMLLLVHIFVVYFVVGLYICSSNPEGEPWRDICQSNGAKRTPGSSQTT